MYAHTLKPFAVKIREAARLLGGKSISGVYEAIGRGELDAVKDGATTLVTVESIERRQTKLPPAQIKSPAPRQRSA